MYVLLFLTLQIQNSKSISSKTRKCGLWKMEREIWKIQVFFIWGREPGKKSMTKKSEDKCG